MSAFNPDRLRRVGEYATRGGRVRTPASAYPIRVRGLWDEAEAFRRKGVIVAMNKKERSAAARELGRRGGLKGGPARARTLSKKRRKEIAAMGGRATRKTEE